MQKAQKVQKGMSKYNKPCTDCPYILEGKEVKVNNNATWRIMAPMNCNSENCVYLIEYNKQNCGQKNIGETKRSLATCFLEHEGYISSIFQLKLLKIISTNQDMD